EDERVEVRLACLDALAVVGDQTSIAPLREHEEENAVARTERRRALVLLEERYPEERAGIAWDEVTAVVAVGALVDASESGEDLSPELRRFLLRHLRMQPGLAVVDSPEELERIDARLWWHRLRPLLVTGRLHTLNASRMGDELIWQAAGSVTVLDYRDRTIRAVLDNRALVHTAAGRGTGPSGSAPTSRAVEEAMRSAAESLSSRLDEI
ncbi:MAG: hypothetical protein JRI55_39775, partial [Deltaproteobacteria bacterium]|nr:hypothetical protein [Deltaproteobacteria bacterium]